MDKNSPIFISSDHNGNAARAYILTILNRLGYTNVRDLGPSEYDGKVDYPDVACCVCEFMEKCPEQSRGILVCGTGTGLCIMANRFPWIRAALVTDRATAALSREHNDANVLVLGQWRNSLGSMDEIVKTWLETPFFGGRHVERVRKLGAHGCSKPGLVYTDHNIDHVQV